MNRGACERAATSLISPLLWLHLADIKVDENPSHGYYDVAKGGLGVVILAVQTSAFISHATFRTFDHGLESNINKHIHIEDIDSRRIATKLDGTGSGKGGNRAKIETLLDIPTQLPLDPSPLH